jgi:hypothetical protein
MTPEELMREVVAAFEKADLQPLLAAFEDETAWKSASTIQGKVCLGREYQNRAGRIEILSHISAAYHFWRFKPKEITSLGEIVWGLFEVEADYMPINKPRQQPKYIIFECAIRWHARNNKIIEHKAFFDTDTLLIQRGELPS